MDLVEIYCRKCGGMLERISEEQYKCAHCRSVFYEDHLQREVAMLSSILDTAKQEKLSNLRRLLWTELKKEYTNSEEIISYCKEIKKLYPEDYYANLYSVLNGGSDTEVNEFLDKTNAVEYSEDIPDILSFMLKSLKSANLISVADLIERAYGSDRGQYEKYMTEFEAEAEKVEQGVYDPSFPRDVFVMYSSADMAKVKSLARYLEEQGITCFVAARNLQHGRGAVVNYQKSLETALDNCKSIVFVSSNNSRSLKCDAIRLEIPYVQKKDLSNAPGELRNRYDTLPDKYKKPRVEYVIDSYTGKNAVEKRTKEFFGTLQWAQSEEAVAERVIDILSGTPAVDEAEIRRQKEAEEAEARRKAELEELKHNFEEQLKQQQEALKNVGNTTSASTGTATLLKRVYAFLADGDFKSADEYCERVLDIELENAEAYLGKLMVELKVNTREKLKTCITPFDGSANYKKAIRYGSTALKEELEGYIREIKGRNEAARKEQIYLNAIEDSSSSELSRVQTAINSFKSIIGYMDVSKRISDCEEKIKVLREREEARRKEEKRLAEERRKAEATRAEAERNERERRLEEQREKEEAVRLERERRRKRNRKIGFISAPIVCAVVAFIIFLNAIIIPNGKYNKAVDLMRDKRYEEAIAAFEALDGYKDSKDKISDCNTAILEAKYNDALSLMNTGKHVEAIAVFEAIDGYKDSKDKINECKKQVFISENGQDVFDRWGLVEAGTYLTYGKYEQDNDVSNGKESIEWLVLDVRDRKALVISKYALDCKKYNETEVDVTWETCTLRGWLNNDFINTAFMAEEKAMIPTVTVSADKNPLYSTNPGNATLDKIFLLSITEANKYFASSEERECKSTEYAEAQGAYTSSSNRNCWWWLRTLGNNQSNPSNVDLLGDVNEGGGTYGYGYVVYLDNVAVRPAMWIDLNS